LDLPILLENVLTVAIRAGDAIMAVYQAGEGLLVDTKADDSPLTEADRASHRVILGGLSALTPDIPVLSEEGELPPLTVRRAWQRYWLVDPLDGTREFISRNGEFTVNIALVEAGVPVLGVVMAPVTGKVWVGARGAGARVGRAGEALEPMRVRRVPVDDICVVGSRRHGAEALEALMQRIATRCPSARLANLGSSLKFCLLAEGEADLYPRLTPVSEWDAAAAHAVLSAAGGEVYGPDFQPLRYNQGEGVIIPQFVAVADLSYDWDALVAFG
jgi:3'(2'), 5'-bisphosphate nucleotidase